MNSISVLPVFLVFLIIFVYLYPSESLEFDYHRNEVLEDVMKSFQDSTKNIYTRLYSIGNSINGVPLWVIELSGSNRNDSAIPNIKFVANIHGNEAVGRELLLHFMEYLRDNYGRDESVTCLLDNSRIHLLPSMNPDGFAKAIQKCEGEHGRMNTKNEDLNRDFPDFYHNNSFLRQPETDAVIKWMDKIPFVLSAGLHGGAMVANYPFDTVKMKKSSVTTPSLTPDDDVFVHLARTYAENHPKMKNGRCENDTDQGMFNNGITNGAAWYYLIGGMQDYNYYKKGCMELTLEISCCKYPESDKLKDLWEQNKKSLIEFSLQALRGIVGQVLDNTDEKPVNKAVLEIVGRNMSFYTSEEGFFWRILLPGEYTLKVKAPGYHTRKVNFQVKEDKLQGCPKRNILRISLINSTIPTPSPEGSLNVIHRAWKKTRGSKSITVEGDTQSRILNNFGTDSSPNKKKLSEEDELKLFKMVFGEPKDCKNTTEEEIRKFMINDLDIKDMSSFDELLKDFNKKNEIEKLKVLEKIAMIVDGVFHIFTSADIIRKHLREFNVTDFSPYEDLLKDFDKKSGSEKKIALKQLLERYQSILKNKTVNNSGLSISSVNLLMNVFTLFIMIAIH